MSTHLSGLVRLGGDRSCGPRAEFLPLLRTPIVQILNGSATAFDERGPSVHRDAVAVDEAGMFRHQVGAKIGEFGVLSPSPYGNARDLRFVFGRVRVEPRRRARGRKNPWCDHDS